MIVAISAPEARELTLEQRVEAQAAIERVYHAHRDGARVAFEEAVPAAVVRGKAEEGPRLSLALERFWDVRITDSMLAAELDRITSDTRMPGRLLELFAALGDDPFVIKETLVRRILAQRLARELFSRDERLGVDDTGERLAWSEWWEQTGPAFDVDGLSPAAGSGGGLPAVDDAACSADSWNNRSLDDLPDPRRFATSVWTGSELLVWVGFNGSIPLDTGGRYDPATDDWEPISRGKGAPGRRYRHTAVWTGTEMIVFGGATEPGGGLTNTGGRYDPTTDSWTALTTTGAPSPRWRHTAVWTGTEMIVWGGQELNGTGGRYDPETDSWTPVSDLNRPTGRKDHTAVWSGSQMIVWGGSENDFFGNTPNTGARYDPDTDTWLPTSVIGAPPGQSLHTATWAEPVMIVWGGQDGGGAFASSGGIYNPSSDQWTPTSVENAPSARAGHAAVWDGSGLVVWGGSGALGALGDGARYSPGTSSWTPISSVGAPEPRGDHSFGWDGSRLIVWGGLGLRDFNTGGRYDPVTDSWTPTSTEDAPGSRRGQTAVWTGSEMLLWGGSAATNLDSGSSYDPALDTWSPISMTNAPAPRSFHTAVWTGDRMVVWGGGAGLDTGGVYDPVSDSWSPTSLDANPAGRRRHTAVWTGSEMIVWGGWSGGVYLDDGATYDPVADTWAAIASAGAPAGREVHTAVWTGSEMIVWGGIAETGLSSGGGRYDPVGDSWIATDERAAPSARAEHSAIWTGSEMIVWGGDDNSAAQAANSGGLYDPVTDTWTPTEDEGAATPSARRNHVAVWSGTEMLVWGGRLPGSPIDEYPETGGRYDPVTDTWSQIPGPLTLAGRHDLSVVWTGDELIVWGGASAALAEMGTGGAYCACATSEFFRDDDGDGFGNPEDGVFECAAPAGFVADGSDCSDLDGDVWAAPGEAGGLRWIDADTLEWDPPAEPGATGVLYDLVRSGNPADFVTGGECVVTDTAATTADDLQVPATGSASYYLVRAVNDCPGGSGALGDESDGTPRTAVDCP
jgi:N-acetylneuraminic acid mutarotase